MLKSSEIFPRLSGMNNRVRMIQRLSGIGLWEMRLDGDHPLLCEEACRIFGIPGARGLPEFLSVVHPAERDMFRDALARASRGAAPLNLRHRIVRGAGEVRHVHQQADLMVDEGGASVLCGTVQDVTAQHLVLRRLEESETLLRLNSRMAHIGGWKVELPDIRVVWSDEVCAIHGLEAGAVPSLAEALGFFAPEWRPKMRQAFNACLRDGLPFDEEAEINAANGRRAWVRVIGQAVRDDCGAIVRIHGAFRDTTAKKQAELVASRSEQRFQQLADAMPQIVWTAEADGRVNYASQALTEYSGLSHEELAAERWVNALHPDDVGYCFDRWAECIRTGMPYALEFRLRCAELGSYRRHLVRASPIRNEAGVIVRWYGTATDIHDRSMAEEALRESEAKLKSIFEFSPECVGVVTLEGVFLEINPAGLALIELEQKDLAVGQPVLDIVYPEDREIHLAQHRDACAGKGGVAQLRIVGAQGTMRYLESHSVPMRNGSGKVASILSVWRDVTERKKAEDAIRETETRFREMASKIQDVFYDFDTVANRIIYVNPAYEKVWGQSRDSLYADPMAYMRAIHPDDVSSVQASHERQAQGDTIDVEYRIVRPDGGIRWINDITYPVLTPDGRIARVVGTARDITESKHATLALMRSNRALQMLSRTNEAMTRAENESELLVQICRLALDVGGYRVAWVGYARNDDARSIEVMAFAGDEQDAAYIDSLRLTWDANDPAGQGPVGRTIRSGMPNAMEDITQIANFATWLASAQERGYRGVINLPLRNKDATFGVMVLYAHGLLAASDDEIKLLQELADDLAFGIGNLRSQEERRRIQAAVLEADARIRDQASLLDKAQDAIIVRAIDRRILFWNKSAERLYGWTPEEALGTPIDALFRDDPAAYAEATGAVLELGEWSGEITQQRKDGSTLTVESRWTLVRDAQGRPQSILTINTDITLRKEAEREIQHLAFYDPLTALPNRLLLLDRLRHALAGSGRSRHMGALLFIDLDNFKTLNDTLGHDKGDLLLQQVAQRLIACVRESDTVARLGGDEFVVMLEELSEHPEIAASQARAVGEKILAAFNRPYQVASYDHHTTPSIGATLFNDELNDVDELLKRADLAMYQAKAAGRNAIRFFDPEMQAVVTARTALEADLRQALQNHEFFLHYQPQLSADDHILGAEALLRWRHPARGMVSPTDFIPLAEETGLILPLGRWVLETACRQLVEWSARPATAQLSIAVNVSARQFRHPEFAEQVLALLDDTGADPRKLKLELTESLLVDSLDDTIVKMSALKARGVGFSLDDFGTGYSSLSYLKRLPLEQLKIDQSFVRDVLTDSNGAAIARTIVALAHSLGLAVIAEGVETEAQRNFLADRGCDAYQGYWFSRPLPIEELERFMHDFWSGRMPA